MDLTPTALNGLFTNFAVMYQDGYKMPTPWWQSLATQVPSITELNVYGWLDRIPKMREWLGERQVQNASPRSRSVTNRTFELTLSIPKEKILDDQYGVYAPLATQMGWQAAKWPDQLLAALLTANPTTYDGKAFFADDHPQNLDVAGGSTYDNNLALPLTPTNYAVARATMRAFKGADGQVLGVRPSLLVVPPALEEIGLQILHADFIATNTYAGLTMVGATQNTMKGSAELLVIDELSGADTTWYLFDHSNVIKPLIFQLRQAPNFVYRNQPTDDNVFWRREVIFGADARGAVDVGLPFLALRSVG